MNQTISYRYDKEGRIILYVLLIGDYGIGKTSHILEFTNMKFENIYDRCPGFDFKTKIIEWKDEKINIYIVCFYFSL